jgi:ubiquinone/menaquinone biosynthesis C-methylase UbiE
MNAAEHFACSSSLWRYLTHRKILPWVLGGAPLGDHLLEIGAGYGAATGQLQRRVPRVDSLEYDHRSAKHLSLHHDRGPGGVVRADASQLPFAGATFSSAVAILVLHHLKSTQAQDQMFAEVFRVLRPGGVFLAFDIIDSWIHRVGHFRSTFTPLAPDSAPDRLAAAGFSQIALDIRSGGFRLRAFRPNDGETRLEGLQLKFCI